MSDAYVQVAPDSTGKKIDSAAVVIPSGTTITASDGSVSTLTADAIYYRQNVVIGDPTLVGSVAGVTGEIDRGALRVGSPELALLERIAESIDEIRDLFAITLKS